ncbi:Variable major outer membrane lipoprotein (plasmid) [Borrelia crocidurae DOU]|uniref:Variable major outer membrane lipoprotein n=1 Tax=Borrelia crocidurae DOU TaxID=1293575 RepID=W5SJ88_9SPIR|nr:Variable major outer membrane lipoprotein [Borrelia crocidurae DOU]
MVFLGGMVMMIVMGCNSGGVKGEGIGGGDERGLSGAMMEVGRSAENAFYAFWRSIRRIRKSSKQSNIRC